MRAFPLPAIVLMMVGSGAAAFGCQLLYDKNELTVSTGGTGGAGTTTSTTSASGGGTGGTTTSSASGGGGATTTAMGGTGGTGGATVSSGGGGTTLVGGGGAGGTTSGSGGDMDGGVDGDAPDGPDCSGDRLFVLGTAADNVLCATYAPASGWNAVAAVEASSNERPAVAMLDGQTGVGVFFQGTAPGPLRAIELANGVCGAPADVLAVTTKAAPSVTLLGGKVQALFQGAVGAGTDHPFVAAWDPLAKWAAAAQIDVNVFSQVPAGLSTSGAEMLAVYGGGDDNLYRVRFAGGAWQLPATSFKDAALASEQVNKVLTPAVAGLDGGGWLVVFQEKTNPAALRWLTGDGATNTPSKLLATALSSSPVSLARVEGGAVLAFRGTDNGVYATVFDAASGAWGAIAQIGFAMTSASPAVTAGVCTHRAELVYIDTVGGGARHVWLDGGTWSAPVVVGGAALKGVAIAASP